MWIFSLYNLVGDLKNIPVNVTILIIVFLEAQIDFSCTVVTDHIWGWLFEKYSERGGVIFYFYRRNQLVPGFGLKIEYVIDETEL